MSIKTGYADMQGKQVRVNKGVEGLGYPGGTEYAAMRQVDAKSKWYTCKHKYMQLSNMQSCILPSKYSATNHANTLFQQEKDFHKHNTPAFRHD